MTIISVYDNHNTVLQKLKDIRTMHNHIQQSPVFTSPFVPPPPLNPPPRGEGGRQGGERLGMELSEHGVEGGGGGIECSRWI